MIASASFLVARALLATAGDCRAHLRRALTFLLAVAVATIMTAPAADAVSSPGAPGRKALAAARTDAAGTTWLCRPDLAHDPCTASRAATIVRANGTTAATPAVTAVAPAVDCFYVYPTVSTELGLNADLQIQQAERDVAVAQASRFSPVCRVWAPMYRQFTLLALASGALSRSVVDIAYQSLLAGWRDYLAHYSGGRPIVLIGHSQGAILLITLIQREIDPNPTLRRRLLSAILLGGNVTVPTVAGAKGSFRYIPPCRSRGQNGCVIAYSSFPGEPPAQSLFGRPGQGASLLAGQTARSGVQVLCTNPAGLGGGSTPLDPYFPSVIAPVRGVTVRTPWVAFPDLYAARCEHRGGATWLNVTPTRSPGDPRPLVTVAGGSLGGSSWGYHQWDVNLALGDLVRDVQAQEAAYRPLPR